MPLPRNEGKSYCAAPIPPFALQRELGSDFAFSNELFESVVSAVHRPLK